MSVDVDHSMAALAELIGQSTWTLPYPPEWRKPLQSMNDRIHWAPRMEKIKRVRSWAAGAATEALIPPLQHAMVRMVWTVPDHRRRDAENPMYDYKAACDGLTDAGVVPDDIPEWMTKLMPVIEHRKGFSAVRFEITGMPA